MVIIEHYSYKVLHVQTYPLQWNTLQCNTYINTHTASVTYLRDTKQMPIMKILVFDKVEKRMTKNLFIYYLCLTFELGKKDLLFRLKNYYFVKKSF